jgi:hypothetical protein
VPLRQANRVGYPLPPLFCKIVFPKDLAERCLQNRLSIGVTGKIVILKELAGVRGSFFFSLLQL